MQDIERRLIKFFTRTASKEDLDILSEWIKNPESKIVLKDYAKTHYIISRLMTESDDDKIRETLLRKIRKDKTLFNIKATLKYASFLILLLSVGYWVYLEQFQPNTVQETTEKIVIKDENVTIRLEDGSVQTIDLNKSSQIVSSNGKVVGYQNGKELVYASEDSEELVYNELFVPYGKRFDLVLSDGTKVYLNAGTSLRYPVNFKKKEAREVFLKEGEAYFEVTEDKSRPFIVNAPDLDVEVLGTRFNVMAYPEDESTDIVLVEGSVRMKPDLDINDRNNVILTPGTKGSWNNTANAIHTEMVNTDLYIAWIRGNLVFRRTPFNTIIKRLERHYNLTIINNSEGLSDNSRTFNTTIELDRESIEDVLNYFKEIHNIEYSVINNNVIIN